jgi:3-hydroxyisobutyrate dehydrogenase-like beta-hydroxyacid dehydrogenase
MTIRIAVIAPGAMGSAIAGRLTEHKATVLTSLDGRSAASIARARAAGMADAPIEEIASADIILSILPPIDAMPLAQRLGPAIAASPTKPLYVDCNAVSPRSKQALAAYLAEVGCEMVDGSIIGLPPAPDRPDPRLYVSGPAATRALILNDWGLDVRRVDGPIGAAAALKMTYAGINKGMTALGAALFLAAERSGAAADLRREMAHSVPDTITRLTLAIPNMYPKAYRWIGEMREIAEFLGEDEAAAMMFEGAARLFERLAADVAGEKREIAELDAALARGPVH